MSSVQIRLTAPIKSTQTTIQPLFMAIDLGGAYRVLDLVCSMYSLTGTTPNATVSIYSGMQNTDEVGWVLLGSFQQITTSDKHERLSVTGVLRYVRYAITLTGTTPVAIYDIQGYARTSS